VKSNALGKTYTIFATGLPYGDSAQAQFTVKSTLAFTPSSGPRGISGTVSGSGYKQILASGSCPGTVFTGDSPYFSTFTCSIDTNGVLSGTFTVDPNTVIPDIYGLHAVTSSDTAYVSEGPVSGTLSP
jgi:hypothetical protein